MKAKFRIYSLIILSSLFGAGVYDLAINLKISYNKDTLKVYCKKGAMFEQIHQGTDVFIKTPNECINETEEGKQNDNSRRSNSTQN